MRRRGAGSGGVVLNPSTRLKEITQYTWGSGTTVTPNNNRVNEQITAFNQATMKFLYNQIVITCGAGNTLNPPAYSSYEFSVTSLPSPGDFFSFADNYWAYSYEGQVYVWFKVNGTGSDPGAGDYGIECDITSGMTEAQIAQAIADAMNGSFYSASTGGINTVQWTTISASDVVYNDYLFGFTVLQSGANSPAFEFPDDAVAFYYEIDGLGADPHLQTDQFPISIDSSMTAAQVASETYNVINQFYNTYSVNLSSTVVSVGPINGNTYAEYGTNFTFGSATAIGNYIYFYEPSINDNKVIWFNLDGTKHAPYASNLIPVTIATGASASTIGGAMRTAMTGAGYSPTGTGAQCFFNRLGSLLTSPDPIDIGTNFTTASSTVAGTGPYFTWQDGDGTNYYMYILFDGVGTNPSPGGTGVACVVNSSDSSSTFASRVQSAFISRGFGTSRSNNIVTVTNKTVGPATNATTGTITGGLSISIIQQGR